MNENKTPSQVEQILINDGLDSESAKIIVESLGKQITTSKKSGANKDMIYGALWCVGGIVATASDIGFIFWGAIAFGAFQFFRGLINAN